jgi:hypothetical protein
VVTEETGRPGKGFADIGRQLNFTVDDDEGFWKEELQATVDFWSDDDPTRVIDAAVGQILSKLSAVKDQVG